MLADGAGLGDDSEALRDIGGVALLAGFAARLRDCVGLVLQPGRTPLLVDSGICGIDAR